MKERDSQATWNPFLPAKSFVSNHKKFLNFSAERRSALPQWENLVFGTLVGEAWQGPPYHIRCRLCKRQELPGIWLCSLVQSAKGQNMEKNQIFWKLRIVFLIAYPKHECYGLDSLQVHHISRQNLLSFRLLTSRQDKGN